jgi:pimeloyl-ACP methyl ester carboxylesterase
MRPLGRTAPFRGPHLDELVEAVCDRLSVRQVAILRHSWGSVLGALYASRFPGKVTAYVGTAQIGDWRAAESASRGGSRP